MSEDDIESYWERETTLDPNEKLSLKAFGESLRESLHRAQPPEEVPSGTSSGAQVNLRVTTAEEQREFNQRELVRILQELGINASVREYTYDGVRSLYIAFNGHQPYNLSVSPIPEEGFVVRVQYNR